MNAYKKKLAEAYGYTDDSRSFEEVYGDQADSLFEDYEVPDKFKKLFEVERAKNIRLMKKLRENGELVVHSPGVKSRKEATEKYRRAGKESMLKSIGEENYKKLFESKLKDMLFWPNDDDFAYSDEYDYSGLEDALEDEDLDGESFEDEGEDFGEDAMGLADSFEDEYEPDWDSGPALSDDLDYEGDGDDSDSW